MEELKYQDIKSIKVDSKLIDSGAFKPIKSSIVIVIVGVALMLVNEFLVRALGVFFIAIALFVMFFVKDKKTIDVYEKGCVIYNSKDQNLAYYLDFEDIEEWDITHESGHDTVIFTLLDGNRAVVDTFQTNKIYAALEKAVPKKSHIAVLEKKNKEMNASPIDALRNLVKKKHS